MLSRGVLFSCLWQLGRKPSTGLDPLKEETIWFLFLEPAGAAMAPMKKPAAAVMKKPSDKTAEEPDETMEEQPHEEACEQPEEEEAEDDACVDPDEKLAKKPTKHPFTLKNVKRHDELTSTRGWSGEELFECFRKLPATEQQAVWKLFERSRRSSNTEEAYKACCSGPGSGAKKQKMLRGWLEDGFAVGSSYRKALLEFESLDKHKVAVNWLSWKQVTDRFGRKEALQRLQNGTLTFRRSPTDSKLVWARFVVIICSIHHLFNAPVPPT